MTGEPRASCYHCGLPVPANSGWSVPVDDQLRPMCCGGCQAAAETIIALGLGHYYTHRTANAPTPPDDLAHLQAGFAAWNDPQLQNQFVRHAKDGTASMDLLVEGMNCAACGWLLERALTSLDGVRQITANLPEKRLTLQWQPGEIALDQLLSRLLATGYPARPWSEDARRAAERREERSLLLGLGIAGIGMMQVMMYALAQYTSGTQGVEPDIRELLRWSGLILSTPVVLIAARPFFVSAWLALRQRVLSMEVPVALALGLAWSSSAIATITGHGETWFDSVSMFVFFLLCGRFLELRARRRAHAGNYHSPLPDVAWLETAGGMRAVPAISLRRGDTLLVRAGEAFPADGIIVSGQSAVTEAMLTGEDRPTERSSGDPVHAGTLNCSGTLRVRVERAGTETRAAVLEEMTSAAVRVRERRLADRVASWFTPLVLLAAAGTWLAWQLVEPASAFPALLAVLVITCPCALSLATPAALAAATAALRERGFVVRDGQAIENLARVSHVVFDKTGTLTVALPRIAAVRLLSRVSQETCLALAAQLERASLHPFARAFRQQPVTGESAAAVQDVHGVKEVPGQGVQGGWQNELLRLGTPAFAAQAMPAIPAPPEQGGHWLLLAHGATALAWFCIDNPLHPDAHACVTALRQLGLTPSLVSGDHLAAVAAAAQSCGIENQYAACSPEHKSALLLDLQRHGHATLMVGDGFNDAPGLRHATVSVAIDSGADLTRASADVVLLAQRLSALPLAVQHARRTMAIIRQNLGWALCYNITALPAAAMGIVPPWVAALGMSLSSLLVTLNALRLARIRTPVIPEASRATGPLITAEP